MGAGGAAVDIHISFISSTTLGGCALHTSICINIPFILFGFSVVYFNSVIPPSPSLPFRLVLRFVSFRLVSFRRPFRFFPRLPAARDRRQVCMYVCPPSPIAVRNGDSEINFRRSSIFTARPVSRAHEASTTASHHNTHLNWRDKCSVAQLLPLCDALAAVPQS
jgi:hypothetical protein